jgi:transcriptional regulator with XRE-family HTH domain
MIRKTTPFESEPLEVRLFLAGVGERIRRARIARGLTQVDAAERALCSVDTLQRIEAGRPSVRFSDVARVLWALDDRSLIQALASTDGDEILERALHEALPRRARR